MKENQLENDKVSRAWLQLREKYELTDDQVKTFERYIELLLAWNENMSLTAITRPEQIILDHFMDSLEITQMTPIDKLHMIADVGSGAGFPGVPLKIKYPHLKIVLIEVVGKKIAFLRNLIQELDLKDVELYTVDWRTFLRKTNYPIDLFLTRASLPMSELFRMFKPSSPYKQAQLIYWASKLWEATDEEKAFMKDEYAYQLGHKKRKLIVFGSPIKPAL